MKALVWTYENKKPKAYLLDKYYYIKNKDEMDRLIDKLLDIDAVSSPANLVFPVLLELEDGFAPTLVKAKQRSIMGQLNKLQNLVDRLKSLDKNKTKANKPLKRRK